MKVLIWKSKYETVIINAADRLAACYKLFSLIEDAGYYLDLKNPDSETDKRQQKAYGKALDGDHKAASFIVNDRSNYEYETFSIEDVIEP